MNSEEDLDLDHLTLERLPGPGSALSTSDGLHDLRTLDEVRLGRPGRWTMQGDYLIDHYWHVSSIIRHLERLHEAGRT